MQREGIELRWAFLQTRVSNHILASPESPIVLIISSAALAEAMFGLGKPVILILQGGRPFAIPKYYSQAAAVLNAVRAW